MTSPAGNDRLGPGQGGARTTKTRDPGLDLVRCLGVLAIVAGHVWMSELTLEVFYTWHVPVFFFLSGYLWNPGKEPRVEVRSRVRSLLQPYLFWFVVTYAIFVVVKLAVGQLDVGEMLRPIYGGYFAYRPFTTFWFVFALFVAVVLYRLLDRLDHISRTLILLGCAALSVFFGTELAQTPLAVGSALPALSFLALGQGAAWAQRSLNVRRKLLLAAALSLVAFIAVVVGLALPFDIKQGVWGTPIVSLVVASLISWALILYAGIGMSLAPTWVGVLVTRLAQSGFTIVLAHPLILWLLDADPAQGNLLAFAIALVIPLFIAEVARRSLLSQWVTGVPRSHT